VAGADIAIRVLPPAQLVVATGKAPGCAWTRSVLPRLGPPAPGVFMQGLLVYDAGGSLLHSRSLERATAEACLAFAAEHGACMRLLHADSNMKSTPLCNVTASLLSLGLGPASNAG
jgi:hydroxymethylpyrimidine pyrophosphatase-like HAD family hydrolase